ncbi:hypothetical protein ACA910_022069 [Epithemia clementina (nom. ined.)]
MTKGNRDLSRMIDHDDSTQTSNESAMTHMSIPGMLGFCSAHALINKERVQHGLSSLNRSLYLDRLCQLLARAMAEKGRLEHTVDSCDDLKILVNSDHAVENILRGPSVEMMHQAIVHQGFKSAAYRNMLGKRFKEFGVGTAMGKDKDNERTLYMVHLFRGQRWNTIDSLVQEALLVPGLPRVVGDCSTRIEVQLLEDENKASGRRFIREKISSIIEGGHGTGGYRDDEPSYSNWTETTEVVEIEKSWLLQSGRQGFSKAVSCIFCHFLTGIHNVRLPLRSSNV